MKAKGFLSLLLCVSMFTWLLTPVPAEGNVNSIDIDNVPESVADYVYDSMVHAVTIDIGNVSENVAGYDYDSAAHAVTINTVGSYIITGSTSANTFSVSGSVYGNPEYNITLDSVNIDMSATYDACAFSIGAGSKVNLTLIGNNTLKSGYRCAGLAVPNNATLKITAASSGSLTVTGGFFGAGIGGGCYSSAGTINIAGGEVTATGGGIGSGIGGGGGSDEGASGDGGEITICGGRVSATGGANASGIGGGGNQSASFIGGSGGIISVSGGMVTAAGGKYGAGIGGGRSASGGEISISGGMVTATGGTVGKLYYDNTHYTIPGGGGAGIGGGGTIRSTVSGGSGGIISISGGIVTATGGYYGAGIGSGRSASGGDITITGGTVTATGGTVSILDDGTRNTGGGGAGIGGGGAYTSEHIGGSGATVTVANNPAIMATGNDGGEHIGRGYNSENSGTLQDISANGLSYLRFRVTDAGNSAIPGATVTVNNNTYLTNIDGVTGCVVPRASEAEYSVTASGYNAEGGSITPALINNEVPAVLYRSGGGGGGSPSPTTIVGGVSVPYNRYGNNVELNINEYLLEKISDNVDNRASFNLSSVSGITGITVPASVFEILAANGNGAEFIMPGGTLNISPDALASISGQATGDRVTVSLATVQHSVLSPVQQAAVGEGTVYNISVLSGGQNISSFEGDVVTLTLPYTLKEGEVAKGVSIWYLDDAGNLNRIPCTYDPTTGSVSCTLTHLSYYVVGYEAPPVQPVWTNPFADVGANDWFYESVAFAAQKGYFPGTSSSTFSPDSNMTRAMLVTVLYHVAGEPGGGQNSFVDIPGQMWYTDAVAWASKQGIVSGYGSGLFGPENPATREQLAVILYNYAKSCGCDVSASGDKAQFADGAMVSAWAADAMEWAVGAGLITGKGKGNLDPRGNVTRAQVASVLQRGWGQFFGLPSAGSVNSK